MRKPIIAALCFMLSACMLTGCGKKKDDAPKSDSSAAYVQEGSSEESEDDALKKLQEENERLKAELEKQNSSDTVVKEGKTVEIPI